MSWNVTTDRSIPEKATESIILIMIIVVALIGNISLWVICLQDRVLKAHVSTWLMLCLSMADILVSLINMPTVVYSIIVGGWNLSNVLCRWLGFLCMITFIASVMSLTSISIYRYALACHIHRVKILYTEKNTLYIIAGTWLISILLSLPPLVGWGQYGYVDEQSICFCQWRHSPPHALFMIIVCFCVPCAVMSFCYANILQRVRSVKARLLAASKRRSSTAIDTSTLSYSTSESKYDTKRSQKRSRTSEVLVNQTGSEESQDGRVTETPKSGNEASPTKSNTTLSTLETSRDDINIGFIPEKDRREENPGDRKSIAGSDPEVSGGLQYQQIRIAVSGRPSTSSTDRKSSSSQYTDIQDTKRSTATARSEDKVERFRVETRLTLSFFVVIMTFIICWLPFCVTILLFAYRENTLPRIPSMTTLMLGCFNSCCNPIIYGVMNTKYRPGFVRIFCCRRKASD